MSSQKKKRDIVRLRTFADDFERARSQKAQMTGKSVPEQIIAIPNPQKENIHTEEKTALNSEPVFYNAENDIVPDTTYEENVATAEAEKQKEEVMEIPVAEEVAAFTETPKSSILADNDSTARAHDISDLGSGTIIRDTKRKRFRLFPAIIAATKDWFTEKKEDYDESKIEKYTVTKAKNRVDTIKAAAQKQMQAPDEDYEQVVQRLKEVKRETPENTVVFKPKESVPDPQWSHTTNEKSVEKVTPPKTRAPQDSKVKTSLSIQKNGSVAQWIGETSQVTTSKKSAVKTPDTDTHVPSHQNTIPVKPQAEKRAPEKNPVAQNTETFSVVETDTVQSPPEENQKEHVLVEPTQTSTSLNREHSPYTHPSEFPLKLLVTVVVVAILLGVGISMFFFGVSHNNTKETTVFRIPALIAAQTQIPVSFSTDHVIFFDEILANLNSRDEVIQIYPTIATENGDRPVPSEDIARLIAPNAPGSFTRAITDVTFGGMQNKPFIVMKITNFDVGFAGMLQWERTMSADLSPLFGETVTESFDPYARTDTQVRNAFFKDTVAANYSVRLLVDENGSDRIIYAFIDQNTILITVTKEALGTLAPLIR